MLKAAAAATLIIFSPFPTRWVMSNVGYARCSVSPVVRGAILTGASILLAFSLERDGGHHDWLKFDPVLPVVGVAAMLFLDGVALLYLVRVQSAKPFEQNLKFQESGTRQARLKLLMILFTAAVWEELVFRGLPFILFGTGSTLLLLAVGIACALFGMQHVSEGWSQVKYSTVLGVFFSGLVWITGTVWSAIFAHFAGNVFTVFVVRPTLAKTRRSYTAPF